jgi:putative hydrolases of HD superfamily
MIENITKYLYEMGQLKRVKRSGWWMAGITDPESVAEHSFRTAILGYILASLEDADPMRTALMCLFHDTAEARINDLHSTAKHYLDVKSGEARALSEQVAHLPQQAANGVMALLHDYKEQQSHEAELARDADLLECIIQAREYQTQGYTLVQEWIDNCRAALKTETARKLADACLIVEPSAWWQGLNKMARRENS